MSGQEPEAVKYLRNNQEQADMHGVMVKVSRQALDEALDYVTTLQAQVAAVKALHPGPGGDCLSYTELALEYGEALEQLIKLKAQVAALEAENRALHELAASVRLLYQALGNTLRHGPDPKPTASEEEGDMDPLEFNLIQNPPARNPSNG